VGEREQAERRVVGVRVLEAQPELADGLSDEQSAEARRHVVAVLDSVAPGSWDPAAAYPQSAGGIGLLVIDGMIARDLQVGGRWCSELLGPGDLLRPWDHEDSDGESLGAASSWQVLKEARLAVLDNRFARSVCRWPELVAGLVSRTLRRSRWMTIMAGISNLTRVDERIVALMWHLADRWGRVTADGVLVPVPLTHEMIGRLVGAHRPSVTSALGELARSGSVTRHEKGWLLQARPPARRGAAALDPSLMASALPALAASVLG
jgi:CRP/FNR family cyclic AMP-dependent transcriptional regulator